MELSPRNDAISAANDLAAAALFGGNLFGRLAMHPAVEGVCTPEERGKVVNAAWRRYGTVNSISLVAVLGSWIADRTQPQRRRLRGRRNNGKLTRAEDIAVGAVAVTGIASAITGVRFGKAAPGGAVPLESGEKAAPNAPAGARREKRALNVLGALNLMSEGALVAIQGVRRVNQPR
jgi:hypothetical protein